MPVTINASTSSGLISSADTSGTIELQSDGTTILTVASGGVTATNLTATGTFGGGVITSGTAVASTSGTSIDFTSIPSWVKRITIMFDGVSLSATANFFIQLGTGGTPASSGYVSTSSYVTTPGGAGASGGVSTTGAFGIQGGAAAYALSGSMTFTNISSNTWVGNGNFANTASSALLISAAGGVTLSGVLNMVRITTSSGTDTFDAGTINILYEG